MLSLLSPLDAALFIHCASKPEKNWKEAFLPEIRKQILDDTEQCNMVLINQIFLQNAIQAGELAAKKIAKGKPADKKVFEQLDIPKVMLDLIPQYDYWITLEDLLIFMEKPSFISEDYPHGREALARLLCALIDSDKLNDKDIFNYLSDKIVNAEATVSAEFKLGDNTLKSCCREILETYSVIKTNDLEK